MKRVSIADFGCKCGENPLWNPFDKCIYWTDIETGRMFRHSPATGKSEQIYSGFRVGGFTFQKDGSLVLFRDRGNIVVWKNGKVLRTVHDAIEGEEDGRFNDVITDPEGRVFAGTLTDTGRPGRLYRLDRDGKLTQILDGQACPNGMGFTPDLKHMYYTDALAFTIYLFDYDRKTGGVTNFRPWVRGNKEDGYPDGMTVDANGDVWSARWDGYSIIHYGPDGKEKSRLVFPTKKVSSLVFGGKDYSDMYVTTAGGDDRKTNGALAGTLFCVKPGVKGVPEFLSRIGI